MALRNILHVQKRFMAKAEPCWLPICGIEIKKAPLTNSEKCRVSSFLAKNYFPDEPIMKAAGLSVGKADPGILQFFLGAMNDDKTIYAQVQESREILGVAIARTTTPTTVFELRSMADKMATDKARRYMHLLSQIEERSNIYKSYRTDKAWSVDVLATSKAFRRRGIAKLLLEGMKDMASKNDKFEVMKFSTANIYGSRAAYKCGGMKTLTKRPIDTYKDPRGVTWISRELCAPHKDIEVFTKSLKNVAVDKKIKEPTCDRFGLEKYDEVK